MKESKKNILIKADYSQQELRILADLSNAKEMIYAYNNNIDVHLFSANRVFDLNLNTEALTNGTKLYKQACEDFAKYRYRTKAVNFGIIYGQTKWGLADSLNISAEEAQTIIDGFFKLYPEVYTYIESIKKQLQSVGYVSTLMGRRRRFPNYKACKWGKRNKMVRQAVNFTIQGFAADMLKIAMNKIHPKLSKYGAIFVLTVHDEIVIECPKETSELCAEMIYETMCNCVRLSVPIEAELKIVTNYGE